MKTTTWESSGETRLSIIWLQTLADLSISAPPHLSNGDGEDEPGRGAAGVAVEVPLAVHLSGQSLVGDVSHQPLGQPQPHLVSEAAASELPAALQDGSPEAVGALVAHLDRGGCRRWK